MLSCEYNPLDSLFEIKKRHRENNSKKKKWLVFQNSGKVAEILELLKEGAISWKEKMSCVDKTLKENMKAQRRNKISK